MRNSFSQWTRSIVVVFGLAAVTSMGCASSGMSWPTASWSSWGKKPSSTALASKPTNLPAPPSASSALPPSTATAGLNGGAPNTNGFATVGGATVGGGYGGNNYPTTNAASSPYGAAASSGLAGGYPNTYGGAQPQLGGYGAAAAGAVNNATSSWQQTANNALGTAQNAMNGAYETTNQAYGTANNALNAAGQAINSAGQTATATANGFAEGYRTADQRGLYGSQPSGGYNGGAGGYSAAPTGNTGYAAPYGGEAPNNSQVAPSSNSWDRGNASGYSGAGTSPSSGVSPAGYNNPQADSYPAAPPLPTSGDQSYAPPPTTPIPSSPTGYRPGSTSRAPAAAAPMEYAPPTNANPYGQ